jgi:hypothetical protein
MHAYSEEQKQKVATHNTRNACNVCVCECVCRSSRVPEDMTKVHQPASGSRNEESREERDVAVPNNHAPSK